MKKLMVAVLAAASMGAFAEESKDKAELEQQSAPIFWGFANYGIYSGYQLYGSLLNTEPTLQGYGEINANLLVSDLDLGYFGVGVWCNSDLTGRRSDIHNGVSRRAFNEFDFNVHWGKTFWFDDEKTWGLDYRTSVVWYWYPHFRDSDVTDGRPPTTMDWNHSLALVNPYLIPFADIVHEYHESNGNLIQFGVKKPFQVTDELSIVPQLVFVWRNRNYCWCFANNGIEGDTGDNVGQGLATGRFQIDATYMFTDNIGIFAKVAYCQTLDPNLRETTPNVPMSSKAYGYENEFVWGGAGLCVNF